MKILDIPRFQQTTANDCMAACLYMALRFHGVEKDYPALRDSFTMYQIGPSVPAGVSMPQIGSAAQQCGLRAEIVTLNPHLFTYKDEKLKTSEIYSRIAGLSFADQDRDAVRQNFLHYMDHGGVVSPRLITKDEIKDAIDNEQPVIILLTTNVIHSIKVTGYNFHGNLIYGYSDDDFLIHDPWLSLPEGSSHRVSKDLVIYAMAAMAHVDVDNASILKIAK